jgi:STE24 endopeptidase
MITLGLFIQLGYFYLFNISLNSKALENILFYEKEPLGIKLLYFFMILGVFNIPADIIRNSLSRRYKRQADRIAVELGYGKELSSGLTKLYEKNSVNLDPDSLYSTITHSHPPFIERINLIESEMNKIK